MLLPPFGRTFRDAEWPPWQAAVNQTLGDVAAPLSPGGGRT
ncbi:MAG TPA: hypothetical protein VKA46_40030 [Gemmataceae bacterium]|nr:hypothetical protein [Gemmataceae bacterium]